jgi:hypothetical protein
MTRAFPVEGEAITRDAGEIYAWHGGAWHFAGHGPSRHTYEHHARWLRKARTRLHRDLLAWLLARDEAEHVPTRGADLRQSTPREAWTELVLRAALTDSLAEVTDGARLGLEAHAASQVAAMLGTRAHASRLGVVRHRLRAGSLVANAQGGFCDPLGHPKE